MQGKKFLDPVSPTDICSNELKTHLTLLSLLSANREDTQWHLAPTEKTLNNFKPPRRRQSVKLSANGEDDQKYPFFPPPLNAFSISA